MFMMGWTGDAVAASLTMVLQLRYALALFEISLRVYDQSASFQYIESCHSLHISIYIGYAYQTSCFCPATLFAGWKGSLRTIVTLEFGRKIGFGLESLDTLADSCCLLGMCFLLIDGLKLETLHVGEGTERLIGKERSRWDEAV